MSPHTKVTPHYADCVGFVNFYNEYVDDKRSCATVSSIRYRKTEYKYSLKNQAQKALDYKGPPHIEVEKKEKEVNKYYLEILAERAKVRAGTTIVTSEPFAHILSNNYRGKCCDHCLKSSTPRSQR